MDIILSLILLGGGLAFFMFGMNVMSAGLEKMAGGKLESSLRTMTSNKAKALTLGAGITVAIQSSSAMTVMLVGLVNSGVMKLGQTIGVIMGSNIGTTLTAWITSLTGIEGGGFMALLKPENFSLFLALIGTVFIMFSKSDKKKNLAEILIGFAVLMYGMKMMGDSMKPLREMLEAESAAGGGVVTNVLEWFKNPLVGVLVGAIVTGVIQSSAASVAILQNLANLPGNPITYGMAIPIIMGQNIGTCVTALISSIGVNKNARRVAVVHISFNLIGTAVCLSIFYLVKFLCDLLIANLGVFAFADQGVDGFGIALVHTIFNVVTTAILIPFSRQLEKLAYFIIKDKEEEEEYTFIDERLLSTPSIAVGESVAKANQMCDIAFSSIGLAVELVNDYDEKKSQAIFDFEDQLDLYEDKLGTYLVRLSRVDMSRKESDTISKLLHAIGDFERIGDHALNLLKAAKELNEKGLKFSKEATDELRVLSNASHEIFSLTKLAFETSDVEVARKVEPIEQVIDRLIKKIRANHIERLSQGNCTIELGFILADLLNNFERVS
ncbi:MAG: Na/Pi cotransporter family protein, partial [Clostridia bacterium]|nr:Na/Pi cotransporter family protein [Clostridia bacterium]